ncbi:diguanylate cyclase [Oceanisphaera sp. W20_SRM_FM3]|uniref:diguanylate cyclase n=1 Tax=Oceanisphaera sp. W20_SRM_FM3 TaxID=3240267 RepID=UPI003F98141C
MTSEVTALDTHLLVLKKRFAGRTATQLAELVSKLAKWQQEPCPLDELQFLDQLLHRLAGSSGTFGFQALGQEAGALAQLIKEELTSYDTANASPLAPQLLARLGQLPQWLITAAAPNTANLSLDLTGTTGDKTQLLVLDSALNDLADALVTYGFLVRRCEQLPTQCEQCWLPASIIITPAALLSQVVSWNKHQAQQQHHTPAPILCIGQDDSFQARYALAEQGADGLFMQPVKVPKLAKRIEQLKVEQQKPHASKVLLLDDDQELTEHYRLVLSHAGKNVRVMHEPEGLLTVLAEFRPDIVLLDVHMPPYSGVTLARMIRLEPEWLSLPIIYLSSEQDRDLQINALAQGADEFITKPISDEQLIRTVRTLCYRARQLSKLVSCDGLTGLLNHSHIKQALTHEYARVQRIGHPTSLAILDLDHFKQVNDNHGHGVGDLVIKALAQVLQQRLRTTDHLGRYGGEEFVVILPDCKLAQAELMFKDICYHFSQLSFIGSDATFNVTVSVGLAELNDFSNEEQALNAADMALYQQKSVGRDGVTCYQHSRLGRDANLAQDTSD